MKGLLCGGSGSGRGGTWRGPSSQSRAHLALTCQPRVEERDPGATWPWHPQLLVGRCHPSVVERPALSLPSWVPGPARKLTWPRASLLGEGWRQASPVVKARPWLTTPRLAWGLMSSWWYLGSADPSSTPDIPYQHAGVHTGRSFICSFIHSLRDSLSVGHTLPSSLCLSLGLKATVSSKSPSPVPRVLFEKCRSDYVTPVSEGLPRLPTTFWVKTFTDPVSSAPTASQAPEPQ